MNRIVLIILMSLFSGVSSATELYDCLLQKYLEYSKSKEEWQIKSTEIIKSHSPALSDVVDIYMRDQLTLIEINYIADKLLLSSNPALVKINGKLNNWLQLGHNDGQVLSAKSKKYDELLSQAKQNRKRESHPDGSELRNVMRSEIVNLPEFKRLLSEFTEKVNKLNNRVCSAT